MKNKVWLALCATVIVQGAVANDHLEVEDGSAVQTNQSTDVNPTQIVTGTPIVKGMKFSGYAMSQYQYNGNSDKKGNESNYFNLRMVRLSLDGRILNDFAFKLQAQINGNTSKLGESPRLVDAFVEWQRYDFAKLKIGQFKRAFTFENPMNPIDQGFMSYAQNIMNLAGFTDRTGEHSSNGRDIGIQLQGDVLKNKFGRALLHYQVGVYNGQGINVKDVDNQKDIIGGFWVMPVKGMRLGAFGWTGSYARKGTDGIKSVAKRRYAVSGEYAANDWTFRSEYIHSTGLGFVTTYKQSSDLSKDEINTQKGNKADGLYALVIAPLATKRLYVKARYDMYRQSAEWGTSKTFYELGVNYLFCKNLQLNMEYAFVNDRSATKHNYNILDAQLSFRF